MSIHPRAEPSSAASRGSKLNDGRAPTSRTTCASSSAMPSAAVGSGRFGMRASSAFRSRSASAWSPCAWASSSASRRSSASCSGLGGPPLDDFFCSARSNSARSVSSRHRASTASSASKSARGPAPVQRGPVTARILPRSLEINHR